MKVYEDILNAADEAELKAVWVQFMKPAIAAQTRINNNKGRLAQIHDDIHKDEERIKKKVGSIGKLRTAFYEKLGELNKGTLES